ncbi:MAG: glutathione S-transferase N-terminal domain-containing protein [Burkholderiales bacterium]|nr:glutathione S-transferase N-terminal domain-containing protein [Burkholderiales bacterium]
MHTLHYSPGSCSLIVHILLEELGIAFELEKADSKSALYRANVNPKGKVPALVTPQGVLTECVAILEYLCDHHGAGKLLAQPGTWERAKTMERIATLATEVHPLFNRFFHEDDFSAAKEVQAGVKARGTEKLLAWFREQDADLTRQYWSGDTLDASDIYFMVMARWGRWLAPPANEMPNIRPFYERMIARPSVARAMQRESIKPFGTT